MRYYQGGQSVTAALFNLFPEIGLDINKFRIVPSKYSSFKPFYFYLIFIFCLKPKFKATRIFLDSFFFCSLFFMWLLGNHWLEFDNRRQFFYKLAESQGFDPLIADHWYKVDTKMLNSKVTECISFFPFLLLETPFLNYFHSGKVVIYFNLFKECKYHS